MRLLHTTTKKHLNSILRYGLHLGPKKIVWEDENGKGLEDRIAPTSECPPAIYAYPLVEDKKARYNYWLDDDDDDDDDTQQSGAASRRCGIIFKPHPEVSWLCIGTWAMGSDFVTRKRPITWDDFKDEAKAVSSVAGQLLGIHAPNIYDVVSHYDLFTQENYRLLAGNPSPSFKINDLFRTQFCQLGEIYRPGFEVCVMCEVPPSCIVAWADLDGVNNSEAWYDEALTNKRLQRTEYYRCEPEH